MPSSSVNASYGSPQLVSASIHFLEKDPVFEKEKPYAFRFDLEDESIPQTNMKMQEHTGIHIKNIRGNEHAFSLDRQGFEVMRLRSKLRYEDFGSATKLPIYFTELEELLKKQLGATKAIMFRHGVRKRHPQFPISTGQRYDYDQPTSVAHVDTTPREMLEEAKRQLGYEPSIDGFTRVDWINVWKPLRGPLNDWPLTFCDSASVQPVKDFEAADILYPDLATENYQIHWSQSHQWHYLSDHQADELIVFRQASTSANKPPGMYMSEILAIGIR